MLKISTVVLGLIALAFGFWLAVNQQRSGGQLLSEDVSIVYPQAREIGEFQLVDFNGEVIDQQRFKDKWWLVYFGFTFCPDACPIAFADMKKIKAQFDDQTGQQVGFAFISVDPASDTPERLKQYVQYFDQDFFTTTGEIGDLQDLATRVGVVFIIPENPENENYVVDHSTYMLLWNPQVNLQAIFKVPHNPEKVAEGIIRIIASS